MNSLLRICMAFLFFQSVAASLLKINGCKITPANMLLFECMPENLTFESSTNSVMIYFRPANNHDEGDYILLCRKFSLQAVFKCSQPKPPYKWTLSQESCMLRSGDPNSCLKVTASKSIAVVGHYSCKSIPEQTESEKCLYIYNYTDATDSPETTQQANMTNTQVTEFTRNSEQMHSEGEKENVLIRERNIAIIASILMFMVSATITVCVVKRKRICRKCVFISDIIKRKTKQRNRSTGVENSGGKNEQIHPENINLLHVQPTKQSNLSAWENSSSSKETSVLKEVACDHRHISKDRSSDTTQSCNDASAASLTRGCEVKTDGNAVSQDQFRMDGGEHEMLMNKDTKDDHEVHVAPRNKDKKAADEISCWSLKNECKNASSAKRGTCINKHTNFTTHGTLSDTQSEKSPSKDLSKQNWTKATLTAALTKNDQENVVSAQQTDNTSTKKVGQDAMMLHSDNTVTVSGDTTPGNNDTMASVESDDQDLATDGEDGQDRKKSPPRVMRQSSVSAVQESEQDDDSNKKTFTFQDPVWMEKAEKVISSEYDGTKRLEVEDQLIKIHDIMDELAICKAFQKSGEIKNKILENWVQEMESLAVRKEKLLHKKMREIREAKGEEVVNNFILKRAHLHLNQMTINAVTEEPSNPMSADNYVEQLNVGLREKSPTETTATKMQGTDSSNCLGATADRRMPKTGGRAEFQEDRANAPMENSRLNPRLTVGSGLSVLNDTNRVINVEDIENNSLPLSVSSELSESLVMEVHKNGSVETLSALTIRRSGSTI